MRSGGNTLFGGLYCPFFVRLAERSFTVLHPPYTTVGAESARFFLYGWLRDTLLSYPLLHYCWGRCCPLFIRWCAILYCPTPFYTTVGADAARLYTVGCAILHGATPYCGGGCCPFVIRLVRDPLLSYPLLHYCWGRCCPFFFYTVGGANLYCASPYTAPRVNATCFGAMSVDVSDDALLCCPLHCA